MFGPDLLIVLVIVLLGVVVPIWAIADALRRPAAAFYGARTHKTAWIMVLVVAFFLGLGPLLGGFYLLSTRHKVRRQMEPLPF